MKSPKNNGAASPSVESLAREVLKKLASLTTAQKSRFSASLAERGVGKSALREVYAAAKTFKEVHHA